MLHFDKNVSEYSKSGLTSEQVQKRLHEQGYNQLPVNKTKPIWLRFLLQFHDVMIYILLFAAILSFIMNDPIEGFVILAIVLINAILGLYQEGKAQNAVESLKKLSAPSARVLRDGALSLIDARELVVGDIVYLEAGDLVSADLRLLETTNLKIDEATLTGESVPIEKNANVVLDSNTLIGDRINMAYSSGQVTYGKGFGIVVNTGMNTEMGKIAHSLSECDDVATPLQKQLSALGKGLGILGLIICILLFIIGLLNGIDAFEMLLTAISLAVAIIPESLPTVATIVLSLGVARLVSKMAIVKSLPAVETLGSTSVICTDKTGTLTMNKMVVKDTFIFHNDDEELLKLGMSVCNDASFDEINGIWIGDPTEIALKQWAKIDSIKFDRKSELPFDSERKLMTVVMSNGQVFSKGGVDEILNICVGLSDSERLKILAKNKDMASRALRVLALAMKSDGVLSESGLTFVGLVGMIDPPRPEVIDAISQCRSAHIMPVMITGDHLLTAKAIGFEIGLLKEGQDCVTGHELELMSDDELFDRVRNIGIYARVSPQHKERIVKAFQKHGFVVAMTGDGVNDAIALKRADIGCAMGIVGSEVSKQAADLILMDDNFSTIVSAVREGRRIRDNILKAIMYLLSCNFGELLLLVIALIFGFDVPLLAIHILWINLVTDSLPALALGVDPARDNIMSDYPNNGNSLLDKKKILNMLFFGLIICLVAFVAYLIGHNYSLNMARTMSFTVLGFSQLVHCLNIHASEESFLKNLFNNRFIWLSFLINSFMMLIVLYVPFFNFVFKLNMMPVRLLMICLGLSLIPLIIYQIKVLFTKKH